MSHLRQGRIKVISSSSSFVEMIYSWPKSETLAAEDPNLFIGLTIIWYQLDQMKINPCLWDKETLKMVTTAWMKIPANFMQDEMVKHYSFQMLSSLINMIWRNHMDIQFIRSHSSVIRKAAADNESGIVAGFLKYAVVKTSSKPKILEFNGSIRKVGDEHFACTVIIVRRSKASGEDVENYFTAKNENGGLDYYFMREKKTSQEENKVSTKLKFIRKIQL